MKKLYEFTLTQPVLREEEEKSKDADGNEVTVKKTVETNKERSFFLKKPTRVMFDEAELYFGVKLSEGIKAGMLTRAMLAKRFDNDGGVLSEADQEQYSGLYFTMFELQNEVTRLQIIPKAEQTEEEREKYNAAVRALIGCRAKIQDFETAQASFFDQTAENRARTKTIMWWVLNLSYETSEAGDEIPFFGDGNSEEKLTVYDALEEEGNDYIDEVLRTYSYYISYWYVGRASTQEEFEALSKSEQMLEDSTSEAGGGIPKEDIDEAFSDLIKEEEEKMEEAQKDVIAKAEEMEKEVEAEKEAEESKDEMPPEESEESEESEEPEDKGTEN